MDNQQPNPDEEAGRSAVVHSAVGIVFRGFLMGLAEVVPGVSGGTIAFVTGIYQQLITSIASFAPRSIPMVLRWRDFVSHHQLTFLLWLASGMGLGILLFAQVMTYLLANFQPAVWGFFAGVIMMSAVVMAARRPLRVLLTWAPPGILAGMLMLWMPQLSVQPGSLQIFAAGALAVVAWLLPAVSGSFVLLALGVYAIVMQALAEFNWWFILTFGAGCLTGLLAFSRVLAWLLRQHGEAMLSLLTGFMLGSLAKLWPWQNTHASGWDNLLSPLQYSLQTGEPSLLPWVIVFALTGAAGLWALSKFTDH